MKVKKSFIVIVCRLLLGLTFVVSGAAKIVDPWGTALKVGDYLQVWGVGAFPDWFELGAAFLLCGVELSLGLLLLAGVKKRLISIVTLAFMGCFTVVTLLSATVLPVEDCGCFGDLLKVGPWVSFGKNVVLLIFALAFWADVKHRGLAVRPVRWFEWAVMGVSFGLSVWLGVWCFLHLPPVDFLPFRRGVDLYEARYIEEAGSDIALRQFAIFDSQGEGTHELLSTAGRVYILVASRLEHITPEMAMRFAVVARRGEKTVLVTSTPVSDLVQHLWFGTAPPVRVYNMDATTMITMLRARYGVVELYGGTIVGKQNWRDIE